MAQLDFVTASTTVDQGAALQVTLRGDFDTAALGAATFELDVPATGFASLTITEAEVPFPGPPVPPPEPGAPYLVECMRATGSPGPVGLATIDCVMDGLRAGVYTMRALITDAFDVDGMPLPLLAAELALTVTPGAVGIVTAALDGAFSGAAYFQPLWAQGGQRPYTWSLSAGTLPAGISLNPDGALSGTPTAPSSAPVTLTATDQAGASASAALTLTVHYPSLVITAADLAAAAPGRLYAQPLAATGGKPPIQWQADGLPAGLTVTGSALTGTPQEDRSLFGLVPLTLRATDADSPPQTAVKEVLLPFFPALVLQQRDLPPPRAVVVARDLCLMDYDVTASGRATRLELSPEAGAELDQARDELIASIAELMAEQEGVPDPEIRSQYHRSLVGLLDRYRDLDAHRRNGSDGVAIELRVRVDDQEIRTFNLGGQRSLQELRAWAGRPWLPYAEPRSPKARRIREAFERGGVRLREQARSQLDTAFDRFAMRSRRARAPERRAFGGDHGANAIADSLRDLLPSLEGLGVNIGRWFQDLFPVPGRITLTPGRHRVSVAWDGGRVIHLLGGIVTTIRTQSELVRFSVTFQPVTHTDWPRFAAATIVHGNDLGIPGSKTFDDVELSSSGLDIVAATTDGMKLFTDTGKPQQPYAAAVPYPVQPGFTPERITAAVLDPYGRTSLLLHAAHVAKTVLNDGPAGLKLLPAWHASSIRERAFAMTRGPREASGWRTLHVSLGDRMLTFRGLRGLLDALAAPDTVPLQSAIRLDEATCLALAEADPAAPSFLAAGFEADGRVAALGQGVDLLGPGSFQQPAALALGEFTGGGTELAVALRQAREVRLFRWATGAWTPLPPIALPLRAWDLCEGPSASPCLAVASTRFGSVLLIAWSDPDQPPRTLHLYRGGPGIQIGGADGTLAVADPAADKLLVYR